MKWYYAIDQKQFGPVEFPVLIRMVKEGQLVASDLVWNQEMGAQWKEVRAIPELNISAPATASPVTLPPPSHEIGYRTEDVSPGELDSPGDLENAELTRRARASLSGKWGLAIAVSLLQLLLLGLANNIIPIIAGILLTGPFLVGVSKVFLDLARNRDTQVGRMFEGFQCFGNALGTYIVSSLLIFLWSLLFIIPGIIAGISYSMVYFILADSPNKDPGDVISISKEMMRGYKWQFFCLGLRFIGWILLSMIFTLGIGMLWVFPYMQTSYAHFYEMVRRNYYAQQPTA